MNVEPLLTEIELQILNLIAIGRSNKEIAKVRRVCIGTIKTQICRIYDKLNVTTRVQALVLAHKQRIIDIDKLEIN